MTYRVEVLGPMNITAKKLALNFQLFLQQAVAKNWHLVHQETNFAVIIKNCHVGIQGLNKLV